MNLGIKGPDGGPIPPDSPLARALALPPEAPLSAGFADRVVAAAEARPAPLPKLRRGSGWRAGRRLAIGLAGIAALASAAAATGLLRQLAVPVPSAGTVWAHLSGTAKSAPAKAAKRAPVETPAAPAKVEIEESIDTPEELAEAFRRADTLRADRRAERRRIIDQRIAGEIERRSAAGLRGPSAQEVARLRERIAAAEALREQRADARVAARREVLQRKVEAGEAITREDFAAPPRGLRDLPEASAAFERLRRLPPRERRAALQAMPAEERGAVLEEFRTLRAALNPPTPPPSPEAQPKSGD